MSQGLKLPWFQISVENYIDKKINSHTGLTDPKKRIKNIINKGAEKVILNTSAITKPEFIKKAAEYFGSSTITVCIDVKKKFLKGKVLWAHSGKKSHKYLPVDFAKLAEEKGAGEIIIQSIEKDGTMSGYDLDLINIVNEEIINSKIKYFVQSNTEKKFVPNFLVHYNQEDIDKSDLLTGLVLVGDYLHKTILKPNNINYPISRLHFVNILK